MDLSSYVSMPLYTLLKATNPGSKGNAAGSTHILQKIQGIPILASPPPPGTTAVIRQVDVSNLQNSQSGGEREAGVVMVDCADDAGGTGDGRDGEGESDRILSPYPSYVESPLLSLAAAAASTEE